MTTQNLLVELFVEELPPKALKKLGESFAGVLAEQLKAQGLTSADTAVTPYASPRRLGAHISHVWLKAEDKAVQQKLMPVAVGLDAGGHPTPALLKKLAVLGADVSDPAALAASLKRAPDGKAEALFYDSLVTGATLDTGLQKALDEAIAKLPIPKVMSYQLETDCELPGWSSVNFVRPAHRLVALHGSTVVPVKALGLSAGHTTLGHRFEAAVSPVAIADADAYADTLRRDGAVIASFAERRAEIARQLAAAAERVGGGCRPIDDDALLDEVTALVERPNVLVCEFETQFLDVPQECLILTMKANQKYFPLLDAAGKLTNRFLVVSNISPQDASAVIGGNERVAPGRCQVFLRPGPQEDAGEPRRRPGQGGLPQQTGHPGRAGGARARDRPRDCRPARAVGPAARRRRARDERRHRRAPGQDRPADRHGGRVPRTAGHHGRLLRAP